jgi:hypothetical protein
MSSSAPLVNASDLGTWAYCARNLGYKIRRVRPDAAAQARMEAGVANHNRHGRLADRQRVVWRAAFALFLVGLVLVLFLALSGAALLPDATHERKAALVAAAVLGTAVLLALLASSLSRRTGFSGSWELLASDTGQNRVQMLRDPESGLQGKPDFLIRRRVFLSKRVVPVESKPSRRGRAGQPYPWDRLQVAAYVILTRAFYGARAARFGLIHYANAEHTVRLDRALEREVQRAREGVLAVQAAGGNVPRSHNEAWRCRHCPFASVCDQRLS